MPISTNNDMALRHAVGKREFERMTTQELRGTFLLESLFQTGEIRTVYWETDRAVIGAAVPTTVPLALETTRELAAEFFCQRRELGVLNLGAAGKITVDGTTHGVGPLDCLYIGRGSREIAFSSDDAGSPARFYLMSYPAHATYPVTLARQSDANRIKLGSSATANERTIFQYIHEKGIRSCQLVMGLTRLEPGSVWNTMPAHTHSRRSEVYLYFDVAPDAAVAHFMGPGDETRHLIVHNGQAVLSPIWSIHSGCGTQAYSFVWAMGGENQAFPDMDAVSISDLR
jgi:4-deoxy-L-threo-5-hexosulose-uronate ketol-isomerase